MSLGIPRTSANSGLEQYLATVNYLNKASRVGECEHTAQRDFEIETVLASKCRTSLFTKIGQHSNNLSSGSLSGLYALCPCIHRCFLPASARPCTMSFPAKSSVDSAKNCYCIFSSRYQALRELRPSRTS